MEKTKNSNYNKDSSSSKYSYSVLKIFILSFVGILIFFIPIKLNNQVETVIYHISYYLENELSSFIDMSLVFFVALGTLKGIFEKEKSVSSNIALFLRVFSIVILVSFIFKKEELFIGDDRLIFIMRDLITNIVILLPVCAVFLPLLLDYGLIEIVEAYTHKIMKKSFKVSGKVFLNFLIYFFVDNICGVFVTYRLYKDGKLREREACITILNFSILSFSLTSDLCNKINISTLKFFIMEMITLILCNIIICRMYPLKKKKQSYFIKSGYKDINCKKNKMKVAIKKHLNISKNKKFISYSFSYLNEVIYIFMDLIPNIIFIFFLANIIFNVPLFNDNLTNLTNTLFLFFKLPNSQEIAQISNFTFFNSILGIKAIPKDTYYFTKLVLSLIITLQCISICFLIPFIRKTIIPLDLKEIFLVCIERYIIIISICYISYSLYLKYLL
ncbi:MAG: hypothetical protein RSG52_08675 [Terrisporobacter sp.]|uniref:hypothetical protein n=1 Tax=Terrisporobacter sp. TaxID=1965305 RepID=UPI002FC9E07F